MNFKRIVSIIIGACLLQAATPAHTMHYLQPLICAAKNTITRHPLLTKLVVGGALATTAYKAINAYQEKSLYWNWAHINPTIINGQSITDFYKNHRKKLAEKGVPWLWGAGSSAYQVESDSNNTNWAEWIQLPEQVSRGLKPAGNACEFELRYKEDIQLLKKYHINTLRFSVAWEKIIDKEGHINREELARYKDICQELVAHGIKPVITLFHYTEPLWFYHKTRSVKIDDNNFSHLKKLLKPGQTEIELTGWEDPENIKHFVHFCQVVFDELAPYVHLWLTFNSPEGHAAQGWLTGTKPPGKRSMPLMAQVLQNLLEAHVQVYQSLKVRPGGAESKIGILKNIFQLDPWNPCNPLDILACKIGTKLQDDSVFNFLLTGKFSVKVPFDVLPLMANVTHTNEYLAKGGKCLDFIGLNYYCHGYMRNFKTYRDTQREIPTENENYTIYAEGLYRALHTINDKIAKPLNIPIYITENGIGTGDEFPKTDDPEALQMAEESRNKRLLFDKRTMYAIACAIADKIDLLGYIRWSDKDNNEWGTKHKRYGMFHNDFETQIRTPKKGAQYLFDLYAQSQAA